MAAIEQVFAREILDSRGNPTVEVDILLKDGSFGRASVPSGASTGMHEAHELRDEDDRYNGKGVQQAVEKVNTIVLEAIKGQELSQDALDAKLIEVDGTKNKKSLGANAILGVSLAFAHATAMSEQMPLYEYFHALKASDEPYILPVPMMNILNGGKHAIGSFDLQEFMIVPAGAKSFKEALQWGTEIYATLKKILVKKGLTTTVGDEGGYAPAISTKEGALELIMDAIAESGFKAGKDVYIAIDAATSELYEDGAYVFASEGKTLSTKQVIALYKKWTKKYPIVSIEDGLDQNDWDGSKELVAELGGDVQLVGDDLFVTNVDRLEKGIKEEAATSILIKPNQIGTVTETIQAIMMAHDNGFSTVISHRSGETEDTTIADLAVGVSAGQIKTGAPARGERTAKYNQLLRIEEELGELATYAGRNAFAPLRDI